MDMDENGCRGAVELNSGTAEWQKALQPRRPIHIKLDVAPFLKNFELDGVVNRAWEVEGQTHVELSFNQLHPESRKTLSQALFSMATDKVRQSQTRIGGTSSTLPAVSPPTAAPAPANANAKVSVPPAPPPKSKPLVPPAPPPPAESKHFHAAHSSAMAPAITGPVPDIPLSKRDTEPAVPKPAKATGPKSAANMMQVPLTGPVPFKSGNSPDMPLPPALAAMAAAAAQVPQRPAVVPPAPPRHVPSIIPAPPDPVSDKKLDRAAVTMPTQGRSPDRDTQTLIKSKKLGEVLVHMGRLSSEQVEAAVSRARASGERLGRYLLRSGMLAPDVLCRALALQTGLPMTDLNGAEIPESLSRVFTRELLMQYNFVPFDEAKTFVCIAVADPLPQQTIKDLERMSGKRIEVFLAQEDLVVKMLDKARGKQKQKLRKHIRYEIQTLVRYQFCSRLGNPAEDIIHNGTTLNISEGGFLIEGSPTALGSPEDLRRRGICARVVLSGTLQEVTTICHLRSIRPKERQEAGRSRWLLGLEIAEMSIDDRRRLKELCLKAVQDKIKESE
jgi:hypothetical protein